MIMMHFGNGDKLNRNNLTNLTLYCTVWWSFRLTSVWFCYQSVNDAIM